MSARLLRELLADPFDVAEQLGLVEDRRSFVRQARGILVRCPWHEDRTPSCSIRTAPDGTIAVRCHGCGKSGDVLSLVAAVAGLDVGRDFRAVLRRAAELAGRADLGDSRPSPPRRVVPPIPDRTYPPIAEVAALIGACVDVADDEEARTMLSARGLDVEGGRPEARVLPSGATLPRWAHFRGRPWTETGHRLLLPVVDAGGQVRSVRAWRVVDGDTPKRLPPAGYRASGLVLADEFAVAMLRGTYRPRRVIVLEGEPDWLTWVIARGNVLAARIGVFAGSWSDALAARIPTGADVVVRTDHDAAGDRYATEIARSLRARCRVVRVKDGEQRTAAQ